LIRHGLNEGRIKSSQGHSNSGAGLELAGVPLRIFNTSPIHPYAKSEVQQTTDQPGGVCGQAGSGRAGKGDGRFPGGWWKFREHLIPHFVENGRISTKCATKCHCGGGAVCGARRSRNFNPNSELPRRFGTNPRGALARLTIDHSEIRSTLKGAFPPTHRPTASPSLFHCLPRSIVEACGREANRASQTDRPGPAHFSQATGRSGGR
jgi:hypothetical protein